MFNFEQNNSSLLRQKTLKNLTKKSFGVSGDRLCRDGLPQPPVLAAAQANRLPPPPPPGCGARHRQRRCQAGQRQVSHQPARHLQRAQSQHQVGSLKFEQ